MRGVMTVSPRKRTSMVTRVRASTRREKSDSPEEDWISSADFLSTESPTLSRRGLKRPAKTAKISPKNRRLSNLLKRLEIDDVSHQTYTVTARTRRQSMILPQRKLIAAESNKDTKLPRAVSHRPTTAQAKPPTASKPPIKAASNTRSKQIIASPPKTTVKQNVQEKELRISPMSPQKFYSSPKKGKPTLRSPLRRETRNATSSVSITFGKRKQDSPSKSSPKKVEPATKKRKIATPSKAIQKKSEEEEEEEEEDTVIEKKFTRSSVIAGRTTRRMSLGLQSIKTKHPKVVLKKITTVKVSSSPVSKSTKGLPSKASTSSKEKITVQSQSKTESSPGKSPTKRLVTSEKLAKTNSQAPQKSPKKTPQASQKSAKTSLQTTQKSPKKTPTSQRSPKTSTQTTQKSPKKTPTSQRSAKTSTQTTQKSSKKTPTSQRSAKTSTQTTQKSPKKTPTSQRSAKTSTQTTQKSPKETLQTYKKSSKTSSQTVSITVKKSSPIPQKSLRQNHTNSTITTPSPLNKPSRLTRSAVKSSRRVRLHAASPQSVSASFRKTPGSQQKSASASNEDMGSSPVLQYARMPLHSMVSSPVVGKRKPLSAKVKPFTPRPDPLPSKMLKQTMKKKVDCEMNIISKSATRVEVSKLLNCDISTPIKLVRDENGALKITPTSPSDKSKKAQTAPVLDVSKTIIPITPVVEVPKVTATTPVSASNLPPTPRSSLKNYSSLRDRYVQSSHTMKVSCKRVLSSGTPRSSTPIEGETSFDALAIDSIMDRTSKETDRVSESETSENETSVNSYSENDTKTEADEMEEVAPQPKRSYCSMM